MIIADLLHQLKKGPLSSYCTRAVLILTTGTFKDFTLDNLVKPYLEAAVGGGAAYGRIMNEISRR